MKRASTSCLVVLLFSGCLPSTNTSALNKEYEAQLKRSREQLNEQERQTKLADEQQARMNEQQEMVAEQAARYEKLIEKWEQQARRYDAILEAMEKQQGIKTTPSTTPPAAAEPESSTRDP